MSGRTLILSAAETAAEPSPAAPQTPAEQVAEFLVYTVVDVGVIVLGLGFLLCLLRLLRGPTLADRGIASDLLAIQVAGLAILLTIRLQSLMFFDTVLIVSILGFASTVAFAQFIGRRRAV